MAIPQLHPTTVRNESFGGVTYHLEGELVPVLHIEIGSMPVHFETQSLATRFFASGGQIFFNRFTGPGRVGIQSMYYHPPVATKEGEAQAAVGGGILGAVMRGVMDNR